MYIHAYIIYTYHISLYSYLYTFMHEYCIYDYMCIDLHRISPVIKHEQPHQAASSTVRNTLLDTLHEKILCLCEMMIFEFPWGLPPQNASIIDFCFRTKCIDYHRCVFSQMIIDYHSLS